MSFRIVKDYGVSKSLEKESRFYFSDKDSTRSGDITFLPLPEKEKPSYNKTNGHASDSVGYKNISSGFASFSQGKESKARLRTQIAHAGGAFIAPGDVQYARTVLKARTNVSTITKFRLDDVEDYVVHGSKTSALLIVNIFGASDHPTRKCYYGKIRCLVKTSEEEPRLVLDNISKKIIFGPPGWKVNVTADTLGSIFFTAEIAEEDLYTDVRWVATVESLEHHHGILDFVG